MVHGNKGRPSKLKGKKCPKSPEGSARIAESNRNRVWTQEMRMKTSKSLTGRVSPMKGRHLTPLQRIKKCFAMRKSEKFYNAIKERDEKKVREFLRGLYGFSEEIVFFPASKYDHKFARFVLIEGKYSYSFVHIRLREYPEWIKSNQNESRIPVVI